MDTIDVAIINESRLALQDAAVVVELPQMPEDDLLEALELRMESGRVNLSWCMGVDSHGYCGLGGSGVDVVLGRRAGQCQGFECPLMPVHFLNVR